MVDPGPADAGHLERVASAAAPLQGVVLTHSHADHSEGAGALGVDPMLPSDGQRGRPVRGDRDARPLGRQRLPAPRTRILFTGDTVLGAGSVFIAPGEGSLSAYLESLEKLLTLDLDAICPGHGPVVHDPAAKLREYRDHRLDREAKVIAALDAGARTRTSCSRAHGARSTSPFRRCCAPPARRRSPPTCEKLEDTRAACRTTCKHVASLQRA